MVLVTKHHDGFLLWPSEHPNPRIEGHASRDVVEELTEEVKARGMRMGFYYSVPSTGLSPATPCEISRTSSRADPRDASTSSTRTRTGTSS